MSPLFICLLLLSTTLPMTGAVLDSVIQDFLTKNDAEPYAIQEFVMGEYRQYFYDDVRFIVVDTFSAGTYTRRSHEPVGKIPMRLAIDKDRNVYPLSGFTHCAFNEMVAANPICIDSCAVSGYGQFYLDMCHLYTPESEVIVTDIEAFLTYQKGQVSPTLHVYHPNKSFDDFEIRFKELCDGLDLRRIEYDDQTMTYRVDYYVWVEVTGEFVFYRVEVSETGACVVLENKVLSEDVGYWMNRR